MKFQFIDLFCGAGGLGEGFRQTDCKPAYHIDSDPWALETVKLRECYYYFKSKNKLDIYYKYLRENKGPYSSKYFQEEYNDLNSILSLTTSNDKIVQSNVSSIVKNIESNLKPDHSTIIIGGPPCQAYSLSKRNRMRKPISDSDGKVIKDNEQKNKIRIKQHLEDERHGLYALYLQLINDIKPDAFVYENVPGIISAKSNQGEIIDLLYNDLKGKAEGYKLISLSTISNMDVFNDEVEFRDFIVNASAFGVPQNRKRFIIVGIKSSLNKKATAEIEKIFHDTISKYRVDEKLTVHDAIFDLPTLSSNTGENFFLNKSENKKQSSYARSLSCEKLKGVLNHFARKHMQSDLDRYSYFAEFTKQHDRNATLYDLAEHDKNLLPDHRSVDVLRNGFDKDSYQVPNIDKFKVQRWNSPSTTVTAHISRDGHAFIHPDPDQNRSLTVREAARLQSFPDDYAFCGPRTEQFRQVGNAVPCKLANVIAHGIKATLKKIK